MWESTPIVNYAFNGEQTPEESKAFERELMAMHCLPRSSGLRPVDFFKARLGRQNYTWVGEYRNWVWERAGWRVYVSNAQGVGFEVQVDLTKEQAMAQWADFKEAIGLTAEKVSELHDRMRKLAAEA